MRRGKIRRNFAYRLGKKECGRKKEYVDNSTVQNIRAQIQLARYTLSI